MNLSTEFSYVSNWCVEGLTRVQLYSKKTNAKKQPQNLFKQEN